jgi:hypothetical protein
MPNYTSAFGFRKPIKGEMNWLRDYNWDCDKISQLLVAIQAGQTPENITNLAAFSTRL